MRWLVLILLLSLFFIGGCTIGGGVSKATAKCIASQSTLYIKTGCHYCEDQKELFGKSFEYLNVVNCIEEPIMCIEADIRGVPTWVIDSEKIGGVQSIDNLRELTGC